MVFNRFSEAVSLLVKIALNGSSASESGGVNRKRERGRDGVKKKFNSLKTLLIVWKEQQIELSYKTLIDLWKVEATAGSHVPMLNCTPGLNPHETVIIKKQVSFQSKSLGWRKITNKRLTFTASALCDKLPKCMWTSCRFARLWKALVTCFQSFTFRILKLHV